MRRLIVGFLLLFMLVWPEATRAYPGDGDPALNVSSVASWIEWWEANRNTYIRKVVGGEQGGLLESSESMSGEEKGPTKQVLAKVVAALLEATHDDSTDVRAEAALALGRMGVGKERLVELTHDSALRVRCRAWVCLGLMQQEDELLEKGDRGDAESLAVMTGLGLLDKPGDEVLQRVRIAARSGKETEIQRTAIWVLRVYHKRNLVKDDGNDDNSILLDVVKNSGNAAVVSEALLAMGTIGGWDDLPQLVDVAKQGRQTLRLPAYAGLMTDIRDLAKVGKWQMDCMRGAACLALAEMNDATRSAGNGLPNANGGVDSVTPLAREAVTTNALKWVSEPANNGGMLNMAISCRYYPGISVLALPQFGDAVTVDILLGQRVPGVPVTSLPHYAKREVENNWYYAPHDLQVQRGYAAMAAGILGGKEQELFGRASDLTEMRHFRAACVLALGLGGNRGNAGMLAQLADQLDPRNDELVCGYTVLALGLLHDPRALEYASKFSLVAGAKTIDVGQILKSNFNKSIFFKAKLGMFVPHIEEMDHTLGVRAELLGLAILEDKRAGPALLANWGADQWISLAAARAMGWCGVYDGVDPLIELMQQKNQQNVQAWAARSLGEMFDPDKPSKLGRLIEGEFYPYPVQTTLAWLDLTADSELIEHEFQGLTNPLLYWQILPSGRLHY